MNIKEEHDRLVKDAADTADIQRKADGNQPVEKDGKREKQELYRAKFTLPPREAAASTSCAHHSLQRERETAREAHPLSR